METRSDVQNESVTGLTLLVVEDDQGISRLLERNLVRAGFQTDSAANGCDAIARVNNDDDIILLLDYQLPDMTGKQVVEKLSAAGYQVPFVIMTGQGDERIAVEMMKLGARDYVVKDASFMDLLPQVVKRVVREVNAERKLKVAEAEVLDYAKQLETLFNIGVTISQTINLQELLERVLERILGAMDMQAGGIFLFESETGELTLRAYKGVSEQFARMVERVKASEGFTRQALLSGKPLLVEDVGLDRRLKRLGVKSVGIHSLAAVPISAKEKLLGVIVVASYVAHRFPDRDVRLLETISNHIVMAIENAQLYEETVQLAFTDSLTGLYNRRYLMEQIDRDFARATRHKECLSVIMTDLDGLKTVNDNFGHSEGDAFLCEIAKVIKRETRASDVAARWGGDEFMILAPDTECEDACRIGERIRSEVELCTLKSGGRQTTISVSVGVASYPTHATQITELFQRADDAVYQAKKSGKNRVCLASPLQEAYTVG